MKGNEHMSLLVSVFLFFPFDVLFRKNWLNAPTGTRTHVSWSLVRRDNHYTTGTHHAGDIASLEVQSYHRGWPLGPNLFNNKCVYCVQADERLICRHIRTNKHSTDEARSIGNTVSGSLMPFGTSHRTDSRQLARCSSTSNKLKKGFWLFMYFLLLHCTKIRYSFCYVHEARVSRVELSS